MKQYYQVTIKYLFVCVTILIISCSNSEKTFEIKVNQYKEKFPLLDPSTCVIKDKIDLAGFKSDYSLIHSDSYIQDKNFYLLTLFEQLPEITTIFAQNSNLSSISMNKETKFREAAASCLTDISCYVTAIEWTNGDEQDVVNELGQIAETTSSLNTLINNNMRPSGMFQLYAKLSDSQLLKNAWIDAIDALNTIFINYSKSFDGSTLHEIVSSVNDTNKNPLLFFQPLLKIVLKALEKDGRDEASRYEPLISGENRLAISRIPGINWKYYPYSLILVPGQGPDTPDVSISQLSKMRCDLAAERFFAEVAPLIVVSGGHVHPDRTPYSEAIEMKKYLMTTYQIPEEDIIVDPHARHTTTNLRNVARIFLRYGIPADSTILVTSDSAQSIYIAKLLDNRCLNELKYLPYRLVKLLSVTDSCLLPDPNSLYADASDPLDP